MKQEKALEITGKVPDCVLNNVGCDYVSMYVLQGFKLNLNGCNF